MTDNRCRSPTRLAWPLGMGHPRGQVATVAALPALADLVRADTDLLLGDVMRAARGARLACGPAGGWSLVPFWQPTPGARKGIAEMPQTDPRRPPAAAVPGPGRASHARVQASSARVGRGSPERLRVQAEVPPAPDASHLPRQRHRRTATRQALHPGRRPGRGPRCKRLACQRRRGQGEHDTRDEQHQDKETSNMS